MPKLSGYSIEPFNTGSTSENVQTIPVGSSSSAAVRTTLFSISLPKLRAGSVLWFGTKAQATNDLGFNVMLAGFHWLTHDGSYASRSLELSEANGYNITPGMHHGTIVDFGCVELSSAPSGRVLSYIVYSASTAASSGDTLRVDQDYGRLSGFHLYPT